VSLASLWGQAIGYLDSQNIEFVREIFQYPERQTPTSVFFPTDLPGITTSVVIWSWVSQGSEHRIATGPSGPPPNGRKFAVYELNLNCVLRGAYATRGDPTRGDAVQLTAADNTTFIDALRDAVRYSRNAGGFPVGAGEEVFQWGEGETEHMGGNDIRWVSDTPVTLEGAGVAGLVEIRTRFSIWISEIVAS
jgi:hypothetical protein